MSRPFDVARPTAAELVNEVKVIRRWLRSYGVAPSDIDDVAAKTIFNAWWLIEASIYRPDPRAPDRVALLAFLRGVTWRSAGTFYNRAHHRREVLQETVDSPHLAADPHEALLARRELGLLDKLSPERREVLMRTAMGEGIPEIAAQMGACKATTWTRLRLARLDLLAILKRRAARER